MVFENTKHNKQWLNVLKRNQVEAIDRRRVTQQKKKKWNEKATNTHTHIQKNKKEKNGNVVVDKRILNPTKTTKIN